MFASQWFSYCFVPILTLNLDLCICPETDRYLRVTFYCGLANTDGHHIYCELWKATLLHFWILDKQTLHANKQFCWNKSPITVIAFRLHAVAHRNANKVLLDWRYDTPSLFIYSSCAGKFMEWANICSAATRVLLPLALFFQDDCVIVGRPLMFLVCVERLFCARY